MIENINNNNLTPPVSGSGSPQTSERNKELQVLATLLIEASSSLTASSAQNFPGLEELTAKELTAKELAAEQLVDEFEELVSDEVAAEIKKEHLKAKEKELENIEQEFEELASEEWEIDSEEECETDREKKSEINSEDAFEKKLNHQIAIWTKELEKKYPNEDISSKLAEKTATFKEKYEAYKLARAAMDRAANPTTLDKVVGLPVRGIMACANGGRYVAQGTANVASAVNEFQRDVRDDSGIAKKVVGWTGYAGGVVFTAANWLALTGGLAYIATPVVAAALGVTAAVAAPFVAIGATVGAVFYLPQLLFLGGNIGYNSAVIAVNLTGKATYYFWNGTQEELENAMKDPEAKALIEKGEHPKQSEVKNPVVEFSREEQIVFKLFSNKVLQDEMSRLLENPDAKINPIKLAKEFNKIRGELSKEAKSEEIDIIQAQEDLGLLDLLLTNHSSVVEKLFESLALLERVKGDEKKQYVEKMISTAKKLVGQEEEEKKEEETNQEPAQQTVSASSFSNPSASSFSNQLPSSFSNQSSFVDKGNNS